MSKKQIQIRTNVDSSILLASIKKLNEKKIKQKEEERLKIEESKKIREQKSLDVENKMFEQLQNLDNPYHKISYMKKRIVFQKEYLSNIKGKLNFSNKIIDLIRILNRKNAKPIRKKIPRNIIEQNTPYKYEVNSRKVLKDLMKYVNDNKRIFEEWSQDVKGQIKKSETVLKELKDDERGVL